MKLTRCDQGHFYDADKYTSCPHCQASPADDPSQKTMPSVPPASQKTMPMTPPTTPAPQPQTVPSAPAAPAAPQPQANQGGSSLHQAVDDVQKTVGIFQTKKGSREPVAGWLVCVDGPHLGEDFRIKMGRNFVGRSNSMDIVLANDSSVSRDKHSIIVYEPKGNMFIIQAGDSKELSYLNDRVILSPQELNPYDTIKLGASTLLFVPFCSENFKWDDIKKDEE